MDESKLTPKQKRILTLWRDGLTGGEIAEAMGTTRSAILGALHRLKAKGIDSERTKLAGKSPQVPDSKKRKNIEKRKEEIKVIIFEAKKKLERDLVAESRDKSNQTTGGYITISELKSESCRFIVNDASDGVYLFCGKEKERGSYCGYHAKMCYIPVSAKDKKKMRNFVQHKYWRKNDDRRI